MDDAETIKFKEFVKSFAEESLIDCSKFFIEDGHKEYEYRFAEENIIATINYFKRRRERDASLKNEE